jgi:AraC-like DNA-binding protein
MITNPTSDAMHFSTDALPERDRAEIMREVFGRAIMRLEFEPLPDVPVSMNKVMRSLPDFGLSVGTSSAMNCLRTSQLIDSDDFILTVALSGGGTVYAHGRETQIDGGSATLVRSADPHRFCIHSKTKTVTFRLGISRIAPLIADLDAALNRLIPADTEALRLLVHYADVLRHDDALVTAEVQSLVVPHLHDLASLAIGATRDATVVAAGRGIRAARLRAIKDDILKHSTDERLSVTTVAKRHHVTPRYVQLLFESDGGTFSEYVVEQRLARACRMLGAAKFNDWTIGAIAFDVGFSNLSYFNRTFLRRYGATPSDVREAAQRKSGRS